LFPYRRFKKRSAEGGRKGFLTFMTSGRRKFGRQDREDAHPKKIKNLVEREEETSLACFKRHCFKPRKTLPAVTSEKIQDAMEKGKGRLRAKRAEEIEPS